mgnify:CR=1 FL=1
MRNAVKIAILTILVTGCSVYKEYERPQVKLDSLYRYVQADTTTIAGLGWEDFFTDTLLQSLIRTGLENNVSVITARQRVIEAQANLKAARLAYLPSVALSPTGSIANSNERYGGTVHGFSVPLTVSWEIDIAGKTFNKKRYAKAALKQAEIYELSVRTELIAAIAEYYYTLEMLDAQLKVSETTAESWKQNVRIMKSMKEAGMANEASVSQTEANAIAIAASLFDLKRKIRQSENDLAALLGIMPQEFRRGSLKDEKISDRLAAGIPVQLLSRRPDVMYAEQELRKAYYNTAYAHACFYPSLTLSGEFGWEKALTSPVGWLISAGAGLVQPLFNRGALKANLTTAQARQESAAAEFRQSLINAGREVNNALEMCYSVQHKTNLRNDQIEALKIAEKSTRQLMRHSESTYLEVLTAQQSLLSARLLQITDHYDAVSGVISLYKALGGGWE